MKTVTCPYCGNLAKLVTGDTVYPQRPDLRPKAFWLCDPCSAWVCCHSGTHSPLGRLANAELRRCKIAAHDAFDPIWQSGEMRRKEAYAWLAGELGMPIEETHIGKFDVDTCRRVVGICATRGL